ncbi:MAG: site-specific recombinase [Moraxellaceae bacterium]
MEARLRNIADNTDNSAAGLIALVAALRPKKTSDTAQASNNLLALCYLLEQSPELRQGLRSYLLRVIGTRKQSHLYSDIGIFDGTGFFTEMKQRLAWKLLPPALNDDHFKDVFSEMFHQPDDWEWVHALDDSLWLRLIDAVHFEEIDSSAMPRKPGYEILTALTTLSHRLTALGLDPHFVRVYPAIEDYESPFLALSAEIRDYVHEYHEFLDGNRETHCDEKQALVLMTQCREVLRKIRKRAPETGISIGLTQILVRMVQTLARMEKLLCLQESSGDELHRLAVIFFKELVRANNRKYSLREVFATHTSLLALRVTENAGHTGDHYVTTSRRDYSDMFRSGLGAGFIVGFMALIKVLASKLSLAPIGAAFIYSMNYSLGFMLVHVLHFTIATKQPAMTAARIAASIQETENNKDRNLNDLADLCVNVFRTQFIAIMGNVMLALPMAYLLAWLWYFQTGQHLADPEKVKHLLHDLDPLHSLALFHAAIAGVCLFLSGLISGYYDNKAVYNRIPERLRQRKTLQYLLGESRLARLTSYIENNLGALAGNFYFGIMLGSMGTLGLILGLPLDIRHITFSSAYFGFALVGSEHHISLHTLLLSLYGLAGIGLTNLFVSFGLALLVALRSRGVHNRQWLPLLGMIGKRFAKNPLRFFWPPKDPAPVGPPERSDKEKKAA